MSQDFNQKFCIECQEPHSYFNCPFVVCKNCRQKGHFAGKCPNPTLSTQIATLENIRRSILTELEVQSSAIIPSTSATPNDQDIIEVKEEFQEDIYNEIPSCDKKCRQMSKVCFDCQVFKARGSTENLSAQSINQHFTAQFIIESVPPSTLMIDIKEVGNKSRHIKVIECLTPLMPGNQIVVTFQVKKNLVVTSPSILAETFLCHIPQKSGDKTQHFLNKVGPKKSPKSPDPGLYPDPFPDLPGQGPETVGPGPETIPVPETLLGTKTIPGPGIVLVPGTILVARTVPGSGTILGPGTLPGPGKKAK